MPDIHSIWDTPCNLMIQTKPVLIPEENWIGQYIGPDEDRPASSANALCLFFCDINAYCSKNKPDQSRGSSGPLRVSGVSAFWRATAQKEQLPVDANAHAGKTGDNEFLKHMQALSNYSMNCQQLFQEPCPACHRYLFKV